MYVTHPCKTLVVVASQPWEGRREQRTLESGIEVKPKIPKHTDSSLYL